MAPSPSTTPPGQPVSMSPCRCIAVATAAINLAPDNPYQYVPPRLVARDAGHFLSFSSIVRALSELWPLLAIGFLLYALPAGQRKRE